LFKFQIPNTKIQFPNKFQSPKLQKNRFGHWGLEFICYWACLREAPFPEALPRASAPAEAGA
jgi:hypothetical protein